MSTVNWAGNLEFGAAHHHQPRSVEEMRQIIAQSDRVGIVGSGHSFNDIADTSGDLISTSALNGIDEVDTTSRTVKVEAGVRYGELGPFLHARGQALANLASLPHLTVAGAAATATHGSGVANQNLSAAVRGLELVTAVGELIAIDANQDRQDVPLAGAIIGLGALGAVSGLTLDLVPTFEMQQDVYVDLPRQSAFDHLDEILRSAYSISLFTRWGGPTIEQVWVKRLVDERGPTPAPASQWGAVRSPVDLHPVPGMSAESCSIQGGASGPWFERLPHFRPDHRPSRGDELQSEYFVDYRHAASAIEAVADIGAELSPVLLTSEIRAVAADELWLSPCYQQDCLALHFTWQQRWPELRMVLPRLEAALAPFLPRPHWGKLFTLDPAVIRTRYPRFDDFDALVRRLDPKGTFRNRFLDELLS